MRGEPAGVDIGQRSGFSLLEQEAAAFLGGVDMCAHLGKMLGIVEDEASRPPVTLRKEVDVAIIGEIVNQIFVQPYGLVMMRACVYPCACFMPQYIIIQ